MRKYSYILCPEILDEEEIQNFNRFKEICIQEKCINYIEEIVNEVTRPELQQLISVLNDGDKLVIYNFGNILKNQLTLSYFLSMIIRMNIDLYSVADGIRINNEGENIVNRKWACLLANLPLEIGRCKNVLKVEGKNIPKSNRKSIELELTVINMFNQGYFLREIKQVCNIKDGNTIYSILRKHNIEYTRHKFKKE